MHISNTNSIRQGWTGLYVLCVLMAATTLLMGSTNLVSAQSETSATAQVTGKPGLLLLSHGSPAASWNNPVAAVVDGLNKLNEEKGKPFHAIESCFMEFAQPDAAEGIEKLEAAGCDRIIVVPFFIAPSSHSHFDVPAVLGLYSSPSTRETLAEENARIATPRVPVTMTQTVAEGDLLDRFATDAISAISKEPGNEAVVILAHGDGDHDGLIDRAMLRILTRVCGTVGIPSGKWAYVGVGQEYASEGRWAIAQAAKSGRRVLVVGLYISLSAKSMNERTSAREAAAVEGRGNQDNARNPFEGKDVVFSDATLVEHPDTVAWIFETAQEALDQ